MVRTVRKEIEGSGTVAARVSGGGVVPGAGVLRGGINSFYVFHYKWLFFCAWHCAFLEAVGVVMTK